MRHATLILLLVGMFVSTLGLAQGEADPFPVSPIVRLQASFWEKIFRRYRSTSFVIHDPELVDIIIDVVDYDQFAKKYNKGRTYTRSEKKELLNRYTERYQLAINRLQKLGKKALEYGPMEQRVLQVYSRRKESLNRLFTEEIYLRTQQGLADEFIRAAQRADQYLPYMENIFRNRQLPPELTRIAFVESMFNKDAYSKVGASGVWQFMPGTARLYMTVNPFVDERLSPLKASYGAAMMLGENKSLLKEWPLAITAYNHGPGGMRKAVKTVGTTNMDVILRRYQNPTFGFASRNFYSEFIAARASYREISQGNKRNLNPLRIDHIRLDHPMTVDQIVSMTPIDEKTLREYNECLLPNAYSTHRHKPLPAGFEIIIPQSMSVKTKLALRSVTPSNLAIYKARQ
ncbi:MAG: lytic transglycosylase domain-containing protein [Chitinophagaceae bacterium]|nr:lytic transglycosylase domain-containing protein [Oligoflexus sp.]